jgi:hypothetical protein
MVLDREQVIGAAAGGLAAAAAWLAGLPFETGTLAALVVGAGTYVVLSERQRRAAYLEDRDRARAAIAARRSD